MLVLNIFGGPSVGKSTVAHGLMYHLKIRNQKVEIAMEYAKDLVYDKLYHILKYDQHSIFLEQNKRVERFNDGTVDYVVTDCSMFVGLTYTDDEYHYVYPKFEDEVVSKFKSYNNYNVFLKRTVPYVPEGRVQKDIETARKVDEKMLASLNKHSIEYKEYDPSEPDGQIFKNILADLGIPF